MPHVIVSEDNTRYSGRCSYGDYNIDTKSDNPYDQDKWYYTIDHLVLVCTAYKAVLSVYGYVPHVAWTFAPIKRSYPQFEKSSEVIIDEEFDPAGRDAFEHCEYSVVCDLHHRIIQCVLFESEDRDIEYASPHENLLLGVVDNQLSELVFLNVSSLPGN